MADREHPDSAPEAASAEEDFATLFEQSEARAEQRQEIEVGQAVSGRVIAVGQSSAFVEIGAKGEAEIDLAEFRDPDTGEVSIKEGDRIDATVTDDGRQSGSIVLKQTLGKGGHLPGELEQAFEHGVAIEGLVTGENKGGFDIQIGAARAFCPRSQIDRKRGPVDAADYINERFAFRITKIDAGGRDVVVSRRVLLDEEAAEQAARTWTAIEVGAVLSGKVTNLKPFGVFVDLGGVEGMIHISEIQYGRVEDPADVLSIGQELQVKVIKVADRDDGRKQIGLSLRELAQDPWSTVTTDFPPGTVVRGTVRRLEPFGAFVEIAPGLEGLVHISKITLDRRLSHARQELDVDQVVDVTVLAADAQKRRISLSIVEQARNAREAAEAEQRAEEKKLIDQQNAPQALGSFADLLKGK